MKTVEGSVHLVEDQIGDILVVRIEGRLDAVSAPRVERQIFGQIDSGHIKILLDFTHLVYVSSAGMRTLLSISKRLKGLAGRVIVSSVQPEVLEVLKMTSFDHILELTPTEEEALRKLS